MLSVDHLIWGFKELDCCNSNTQEVKARGSRVESLFCLCISLKAIPRLYETLSQNKQNKTKTNKNTEKNDNIYTGVLVSIRVYRRLPKCTEAVADRFP